jgi:ferredoxin/rubrerythrin
MKLHVESSNCIRCGACATLCPGLFDVTGPTSRVVRQPKSAEHVLADAARWICPTDAIRITQTDDETIAPTSPAAPEFDELATGAERVRWNLADVPWHELAPDRAPPELRAVVREMAFSENATYSATQRFLDTFFDDIDFSQWIAVWFYEETRHPHVLVEWLRRVGEPVPNDFVLKGRVSTPFMRSIVGTLVTNVISEVTAAQAYRRLARGAPESVLASIAQRIAGDEARHAATFFRFAWWRLAREEPEIAHRSRARGVEVLQAWLGGVSQTTHPVAQMIERLSEGADLASLDLDFTPVRTRVVRVVGLLLELPLRREEDVATTLRELLAARRQT